jgi:hypothetical protein
MELGSRKTAAGEQFRVAAKPIVVPPQRLRCNAPPFTRSLIAGARKAVIQSRPAGLMSAVSRASVIMPRSPTSTT